MTDYPKRSKLPFKIVSSSVNTGYASEISSSFKSGIDIVGHHQDTYAGLENEPLQSPFTKQHVGGNQHRHIPLNTDSDNDFKRPEAFKIKLESQTLKVYGPDFENINKPRAQMWKGAKAPLNISNIQTQQNIAGNFEKNYQVLQTVGRRTSNNLIVDSFIASGNLTTQFITGAHNYSLPEITSNSDSIIVERFNAPGGKQESSRGALDRAGEELSPNNSLTTRNIKIRQPFYRQLTQHSAQFGSGSLEGISIHNVNRNTLKTKTLNNLEEPENIQKYDNFWVQHAIPATDFGYAWITASSISDPYSNGNSSLQFAFTSSLSNTGDINIETQTLLGSLSSSQQWYGTWEQIRTGEHPVAQKLRNVNIISVENVPNKTLLKNNSLVTPKRQGSSTNYIEPPVSNKYFPIQQDFILNGDIDLTGTRIKYSFGNIVNKFANNDLNNRLGLTSGKPEFYNKILDSNKLGNASPIQEILSLKYKENLYPKQINTYLSGTRSRINYILDQSGTGSGGYDTQLGNQRVIWRNNTQDRKRSNLEQGGYINSVGLSSTQESGSDFAYYEDGTLVDDTNFSYASILEINSSNLNKGLFNSIILLDSSSVEQKYQSFQILEISGTQIWSRKRATIGEVAGEFNEGFIDFYGIGEIKETLESNIGSIYKNSFYKTALSDSPYKSGSAEDNRDLVTLVHTEDDSIKINPKTRYLSFLGGVQISTGINTSYNTGSNIFNELEIPEENIVFSTLDNGLIRTTEKDSGKTPFFDSYDDFVADIRGHAKDYSIIPEFRISNHIRYYVSSSGGNFRKQNNSIFELDGNGVSNRSSLSENSYFNVQFLEKYSVSDELKTNKIIENDYSKELKADNITLSFKGIKKLLPYNGFYPQDRTIQLANLYSEYTENNLIGGTYNVSYENTVASDKIFSHIGTTSSLGKPSSFSTVQFNNVYYAAASYKSYDNNRGLVKLYSSSLNVPYEEWRQDSFAEYTGSTTSSYFGQSLVMLTASNGINLYVSEYGASKTGSVYQITSSNGSSWSAATKILDSSTSLPISGNFNTYFGNYIDAISDNQRTLLTITELGQQLDLNNVVYATYLSGSDLYLGGGFTNVNKNSNSNYIVKYDTANLTWTNLGSSVNDIVYCITGSSNRIYFGGAFTTANSVSRRKIAYWDTLNNTWNSLDSTLNSVMSSWSYVKSICVSGTDLYIGGYSTSSIYKNILKFDTLTNTISYLGNSTLNGVNNEVNTITVSGSDIYVGGLFTSASDSSGTKYSNYITKWSTINNSWSSLSGSSVVQEGAGANLFISSSDNSTTDEFGRSVTVNDSGNRIIVGAFRSDIGSIVDAGKVYIYNSSSASGWTQETIGGNPFISASDKYVLQQFGRSIATNNAGNRIAVGAHGLINSDAPDYGTYQYQFENIGSRQYSGSFYVGTQDSAPRGIYFKSDGLSLFMNGQTSDRVYKYDLSTSFKVDTAVLHSSCSISAQTGNSRGVTFSTDGSKMFVVGSTSIFAYNLSTPWTISSGVSFSGSFNFGSNVAPTGLFFNETGDKFFITTAAVTGSTFSEVRQFNLSSNYNVSTAVLQHTLDVSSYQNITTAIFFNNSGSEMLVGGESAITITRYRLSTPYSLSTAVYQSQYTITEDGIHDIYVTSDNSKMFIVGSVNDRVHEYLLQNGSGKVYVYTSGSSTWTPEGSGGNLFITASDKSPTDGFGVSVAVNGTGNRLIVGARNADISSTIDAGKVYVYNSSSVAGWTQETIGANSFISASDKAAYNYFGNSVDVNDSGNRIVVGAPQATAGAFYNSGKVYIYTSGSSGWIQESISGNPFISASSNYYSIGFGCSVAINNAGNKIVVGASSADIPATSLTDIGMVFVYVSGASGWSLEGSPITASDKAASDYFGDSVDINDSGNRIVVGSYGADVSSKLNTGKVYVYTSSSIGWNQEGSGSNQFINPDDSNSDDHFGYSVAINSSGNRIVAGANLADPGSQSSSGKIYTYYTTSSVGKSFWNLNGGLNSFVNKIILSGSDLYVGGAFTYNKNLFNQYNKILKYIPNTDSFEALGDGLSGDVSDVRLSGSIVHAAGAFTTSGSYISKWNGTIWSSLASNILNNAVYSINFSGNYIYAGGNFTVPSKKFGVYDNINTTWQQSNGTVYLVTSSDNSIWTSKLSIISGSNLAKYSSIISASNGYHVFCTDESSDSGSIRVVTSSNAILWSSGTTGDGIVIKNGSTSTANLGQLPIDASTFVTGGNERIYVFTADKGNNNSGSFYVFSSSLGCVWNSGDAAATVLLTGSIDSSILPSDISSTKTSLNISSIAHSGVLYYSYGTSRNVNSILYTGKTLNGLTWESNQSLYSVIKNQYLGENIDISYYLSKPVFFSTDQTDVYSLLSGKFATYRLNVVDKDKFKKFAALEPFFAPGILYNTIKSGIAVDWPCTTGSNSVITSSGEYGLRSVYYPKNYMMKSVFDEEENNSNGIGSLKSNINYRIPFENIIFPNEAFEPKTALTKDLEVKKLSDEPFLSNNDNIYTYLNKSYIYGGYEPYMNPIDYNDFRELGPKRFSVPFVYRKNKTSDSGLYSLATSNFLSEVVRFFLKDEKLITFKSQPDNKWREFEQNKTYYMDVVIEKSPELLMIEAYSSSAHPGTMNGRYFGYPVNKTNKGIWDSEDFTAEEKQLIHTDPAYAPYTPPYFEGLARARISFKPTTSRTYALEEILRECTIENIYPTVSEGAVQNSDAFNNKMPISSSIDLKGIIQSINVTIRTDQANQEVAEKDNKIWVISPKMETPVLDFSQQEIIHEKNNIFKKSGYGRGMWSGYGRIPDSGNGIRIRLEYPFGREETPNTGSLLEQVGFQSEERFIGRLAEKKIITEAIVAIPYLVEESEQTVKNKTSFRKSKINFLKIDEKMFDLQKKNIENNASAVLSSQNESGIDIQETSISDMIKKMKKYVIPPEMNFLEYSDLNPFIMYFFEFQHSLDQQDLADIWQGLKPEISVNAEEDEIKINHKFGKYEMFGNKQIPANIKWLIFKVKRKAEINYFNITESTKDDKRFNFNKIVGRKEGTDIYSYNWPYDYFSLVEFGKLDIEVEYRKKDNSED